MISESGVYYSSRRQPTEQDEMATNAVVSTTSVDTAIDGKGIDVENTANIDASDNSSCEKICQIVTLILLTVGVLVAIILGAIALEKASRMPNEATPCIQILSPEQGFANCSGSGTVCYFYCSDRYGLRERDHIHCNDGKWDAEPPMCDSTCPALGNPVNGRLLACNDGFFEKSKCSFECNSSRVIKGNATLTCQSEHKWSSVQPKCVCSKCTAGDDCQYSTRWQNIRDLLQTYKGNGSITVYLGGKNISCHSNTEQQWQGYCSLVDRPDKYADCQDERDLNPANAVTHAAATLIRNIVNDGRYPFPEPCDLDQLPQPCSV